MDKDVATPESLSIILWEYFEEVFTHIQEIHIDQNVGQDAEEVYNCQ